VRKGESVNHPKAPLRQPLTPGSAKVPEILRLPKNYIYVVYISKITSIDYTITCQVVIAHQSKKPLSLASGPSGPSGPGDLIFYPEPITAESIKQVVYSVYDMDEAVSRETILCFLHLLKSILDY
jgi:hypothetical protein